jgi:hypothetical protein
MKHSKMFDCQVWLPEVLFRVIATCDTSNWRTPNQSSNMFKPFVIPWLGFTGIPSLWMAKIPHSNHILWIVWEDARHAAARGSKPLEWWFLHVKLEQKLASKVYSAMMWFQKSRVFNFWIHPPKDSKSLPSRWSQSRRATSLRTR